MKVTSDETRGDGGEVLRGFHWMLKKRGGRGASSASEKREGERRRGREIRIQRSSVIWRRNRSPLSKVEGRKRSSSSSPPSIVSFKIFPRSETVGETREPLFSRRMGTSPPVKNDQAKTLRAGKDDPQNEIPLVTSRYTGIYHGR